MEDWKVWALFATFGFNLMAGAWNLAAIIRRKRCAANLDREPYEVRPLLSADNKMATLPERADDEAERKETAEWLALAMNKMRERDLAVLAELRSRTETIRKESAAAVLREARLQLEKELEPLLLTIQKKAQALQGLQSESVGVQGLLEDVRALSEAINKTS